MTRAVIGIGGNLGARFAILRAATALLAGQPGLEVVGHSLAYPNPPLPLGPPQPDYLNAALLVSWVGRAEGLLAVLQRVESLLLRERSVKWGPRTLDLDFLLWGGGALHTPDLTLPHPGTFQRPFTLAPLGDLLPGLKSELAARLAEVMPPGQPPLEGVPLFTPADAHLLESTDLAELLSASVLAVCGPARARATLPFAVPNSLEAGLSALIERIEALSGAGFRVSGAAVTHATGPVLRGVFLGESLGRPLAPPEATAHAGSDGARMWVRIARPRS